MKLSWLWALALCAAVGCAPPQLSDADLSDPGIKARLESELRQQKDLDLRYVNIDVNNKTVNVSGIVNSWDQKLKIERIVRGLTGVEQSLVNVVVQE